MCRAPLRFVPTTVVLHSGTLEGAKERILLNSPVLLQDSCVLTNAHKPQWTKVVKTEISPQGCEILKASSTKRIT